MSGEQQIAETVVIERARAIVDCRVGQLLEQGSAQPASVAMWLQIEGEALPIVLRLRSRVAVDQLVSSLMRHSDEAFKMGGAA
jgi:hypothetical protein